MVLLIMVKVVLEQHVLKTDQILVFHFRHKNQAGMIV